MEELGTEGSTGAPDHLDDTEAGICGQKGLPGILREFRRLPFSCGRSGPSVWETGSETAYSAKSRLFPTDTGRVVNRFLIRYFNDIVNYHFTAHIEEDFDEIARGKKAWREMIAEFYGPFHEKIEETRKTADTFKGERLLGRDPESGKNVYVKIGRYGPMVQLGDSKTEEKPRFASLRDGQSLDGITLEEALQLLAFPKKLGRYEEEDIILAIGRYGPYIKHKNTYYSLDGSRDLSAIGREDAVGIIEDGREKKRKKLIRDFPEANIKVLHGRYGPYITHGGRNYKIPKDEDPGTLTPADCKAIIADAKKKKKPKKK